MSDGTVLWIGSLHSPKRESIGRIIMPLLNITALSIFHAKNRRPSTSRRIIHLVKNIHSFNRWRAQYAPAIFCPSRFLFVIYGRVYWLTSPPRSLIESYRNWITYFGLWTNL